MHAYELLSRNVPVTTVGSLTASSCLMDKTLPTLPILVFPDFRHSLLKCPVSAQLLQARLTSTLAVWLICWASLLEKRVVCPFLLQLLQCISRQAPVWWKLHLLHLVKFPTYCLNGVGVAGVVAAWTTTIWCFLAGSCAGWFFFLFQNILLLSPHFIFSGTRAIMLWWTPWSMSLWAKSLALSKVIGFEANTFHWI